MISFSSIITELQIKIAQKMGVFEQKDFELSSKCGKLVMTLNKHKPVVKVFEMEMTETDLRFRFQFEISVYYSQYTRIYPHFVQRDIKWSKLYQYAEKFPLISLKKLKIDTEFFTGKQNMETVDSLVEISNKIRFTNRKAEVEWKYSNPRIPQILDILSKMIIIGKLKSYDSLDPALLSHPALQELDNADIGVDPIPNDTLLMLKSPFLTFREFSDPLRINTFSNLLFKQWILEERKITKFYMYPSRQTGLSVSERRQMLFNGISYSTIYQHNENTPREYKILKNIGICGPSHMSKGDGFYSIENRSKKLLVHQSNECEYVMAFEYEDIDETIKFYEV